jgi:hypothetical protein
MRRRKARRLSRRPPPNTPHAGGKSGDKKTKIAITYVLEKGKPLASPA